MGKDFLKLKMDRKDLPVLLVCAGLLLTGMMGIVSLRQTKLPEGCELPRAEAGKGAYQQELVAEVEGEGKLPLTVTIEERQLSEAEAEAFLQSAELLLDELLKGNNADLEHVTEGLCFVDVIPELPVEVEWTLKPAEYFDSEGNIKQDVGLSEPTEVEVGAILSCQSYSKDYDRVLVLQPREKTWEVKILQLIAEQESGENYGETLRLPREYQGKAISWKKPADMTFLYMLFLTGGAVVFLKLGEKRDEKIRLEQRREALEKDYPQIVSKFTMLLSAGLSIRNAWERIVKIHRNHAGEEKVIYEEMGRALREMEKGIPELEVYEAFGREIKEVHYKKLMTLFISHKKRGGVRLPETMDREMLNAWEEQKRKTRKQGEIIGTKLLLPMMGMLMVVFLMILVPAFLSFQL